MTRKLSAGAIWASIAMMIVIALVAVAVLRSPEQQSTPVYDDDREPVVERRVHTAEELRVSFDSEGRPYDGPLGRYSENSFSRVLNQRLFVPGGRLAVMDGNAIEVEPDFFRDEASLVEFAAEDLELFVHWATSSDGHQSLVAVEVIEPGESVTEWGSLEFGYGTDGGVGGLISESAIDRNVPVDGPYGASYIESFDNDGIPGLDTVVFSNDWGDGGFPMVRGYNESGESIALAVFVYGARPWRILFPAATPPKEITAREAEISECLEGTRDVLWYPQWDYDYGICSTDIELFR